LWIGAAANSRISDNDDLRWQSLATLDTVGLPAPVRKLLESLK
jgi:A/G-specific adenine glycosylase